MQRFASHLSNNDRLLDCTRRFWQPYLVLLVFCFLIFFLLIFFSDFILLRFYSRGLTIIIFLALFPWCRVMDFFFPVLWNPIIALEHHFFTLQKKLAQLAAKCRSSIQSYTKKYVNQANNNKQSHFNIPWKVLITMK